MRGGYSDMLCQCAAGPAKLPLRVVYGAGCHARIQMIEKLSGGAEERAPRGILLAAAVVGRDERWQMGRWLGESDLRGLGREREGWGGGSAVVGGRPHAGEGFVCSVGGC